MRILMLNRRDAQTVSGGDTVQMMHTKAGLEKLGVNVQVGTAGEDYPYSEFDIVHVFNWLELKQAVTPQLLSGNHPPKLVLSPIFWFHTGHWFDQAAGSVNLWKTLTKGVGTVRARRLYEEWQGAKFRWGSQGRIYRKLLSIPAQLLPNSKMEIHHLDTAFGLHGRLNARCTVVPNGIVKELFDPIPDPNRSFLEKYGLQGFVLQVARIQSAKNQLGLIEALYDVPVPIVFVGQPSPYEADYVQRCHTLGEQRGQVYFLGLQSMEDLAGIYALAAVHALPSWRETPGLASLEAAAAGCRIVSTSVGCAIEYFEEDAYYCDPGDISSIRRAVTQALETPPSEKLRNKVLQHYTWEAAARKTLEVYCNL
jgi:glycosyltransferase involved in cell wall biosynthesis